MALLSDMLVVKMKNVMSRKPRSTIGVMSMRGKGRVLRLLPGAAAVSILAMVLVFPKMTRIIFFHNRRAFFPLPVILPWLSKWLLMQPIIVATDFSDAARNALRFAARLALSRSCPLRVVHAYTWPIGSGDPILLPTTLETIERNVDESLAALEGSLLEEFPAVQADFEKLPAGDIAFE
ncbi:MAG: universal stress protein, partial [Sphingobacteriales bacterium]